LRVEGGKNRCFRFGNPSISALRKLRGEAPKPGEFSFQGKKKKRSENSGGEKSPQRKTTPDPKGDQPESKSTSMIAKHKASGGAECIYLIRRSKATRSCCAKWVALVRKDQKKGTVFSEFTADKTKGDLNPPGERVARGGVSPKKGLGGGSIHLALNDNELPTTPEGAPVIGRQ